MFGLIYNFSINKRGCLYERKKSRKIKSEIIENIKYVQNLDILLFIHSLINESNILKKRSSQLREALKKCLSE